MKKLILLTLTLCTLSLTAQNYEWAFDLGSPESETPQAITHDLLGNAYIVGTFAGTFDADPGPAVFSLTAVPTSLYYDTRDIFVAKYDPDGNFLWAFSVGSSEDEYVADVAFDGVGAIYLICSYSTATDFDPAPATTHTLTPVGDSDVAIAKYDLNGNFLSAFSIGGVDASCYAYNIEVNHAGNVVVSGTFRGSVYDSPSIDVDPDPSQTYWLDLSSSFVRSSSITNLFLATYSGGGTFLHAFSLEGNNNIQPYDMTIDPADNVLITGAFWSTVDFDPGTGTNDQTVTGGRERDIFLAKYSATGLHQWAFAMGNNSVDAGSGITTDASGNAYLVGNFNGAVDFDPGAGTDILNSSGGFVAKYDPNGNHLWAFPSGRAFPISIALDGAGNLIVAGHFFEAVDLDPSSGEAILSPKSDIDIFLARYSAAGSFIGALSDYGGQVNTASNSAIDPMGNIFIIGTVQGIHTPSPSICDVPSFGFGSSDRYESDIFMVKYGPNPGAPICNLPSDYSGVDVGDVSGNAGSTAENAGVYTLNASGTGIKGTADGFHFAADEAYGDIDLIVRVTGIQNNASRQAGLMLRECLGPNAPNVAIVVNGQKQVKMTRRDVEGGVTLTVATKSARRRLNSWLRLTLTGTSVIGYYSQNGTVWEYVGTANFAPDQCYGAGLAASKGAGGAPKTFTFDNFSVNGNALRESAFGKRDAINRVSTVVYPNPFGDRLSYRLEGVEVGTHYHVSLLDMTGRTVLTVRRDAINRVSTVDETINTSEIAAGIYFLEVRTADERKLVKVVKR